ncbi:MAG: hypothetical protein J6W00_10865 [Lentisphaeria bacterium]|nr:hypothetical protein [Lentisphaeria bacterium]
MALPTFSSKMTSLASAVRQKASLTGKLTIDDMCAAILSLDITANDVSTMPLTFAAKEANSSVKLICSQGDIAKLPATIEYCIAPSTEWTSYNYGEIIELADVGDSVSFRSSSSGLSNHDATASFVLSGAIVASGNVLSLQNYDPIIPDYGFQYLFQGNNALVSPPAIPASKVGSFGCNMMFADCPFLLYAPELPATEVMDFGYHQMFINDIRMNRLPSVLPAPNLTYGCYKGMFNHCESAEKPPYLLAVAFAEECCSYMFKSCYKLKYCPDIYAESMAIRSCFYMFQRCISIRNIAKMSVKNLADYCFAYMYQYCDELIYADLETSILADTMMPGCCRDMFFGCAKLQGASAITAIIFADYCCANMFRECPDFTNAPSIAATILADDCCNGMFADCPLLETAPELFATTLTRYCYYQMFMNDVKLKAIKVHFIDWGGDNECTDWVLGVADGGVFFCPPDLAREFGTSRIPAGWTVAGPETSSADLIVTGAGYTSVNGRYKLISGNAYDLSGRWKKEDANWYIYCIFAGSEHAWVITQKTNHSVFEFARYFSRSESVSGVWNFDLGPAPAPIVAFAGSDGSGDPEDGDGLWEFTRYQVAGCSNDEINGEYYNTHLTANGYPVYSNGKYALGVVSSAEGLRWVFAERDNAWTHSSTTIANIAGIYFYQNSTQETADTSRSGYSCGFSGAGEDPPVSVVFEFFAI